MGTINTFDDKGDVIRDHRKELELLVEHENINVLPKIGIEKFDAFRAYKKHCKTAKKKGFSPKVNVVKLAKIPKTLPFSKTHLVMVCSFAFGIFVNKSIAQRINSFFTF